MPGESSQVQALITIRSRDGDERHERRMVRLTSGGLFLDGPALTLNDGDRVAWVTEIPGLFGAFTVAVTTPTVH